MYKVGLIGAGSGIVHGGNPKNPMTYCHAGGLFNSRRTKLVAAVDISAERLQSFKDRWGECFPDVRYYESTRSMIEREELDIVEIAVSGRYPFSKCRTTLLETGKSLNLPKPIRQRRVRKRERKITCTSSFE